MFLSILRNMWKPLLTVGIIGSLAHAVGVTFFAESVVYLSIFCLCLAIGVGLAVRCGVVRARMEK